jgi:hypothetical protein
MLHGYGSTVEVVELVSEFVTFATAALPACGWWCH